MKKSLTCRMAQTFNGIMLLLFTVVHGASSQSLNPEVAISQYSHTGWRLQDGALPSLPQTIEQTTDGYIWIGTLDGLLRFDGVRFVRWEPQAGQSLPSRRITTLKADADGGLWIGTFRGLAHLSHGNVQTFRGFDSAIEKIILDRDGALWFTRAHISLKVSEGPLCKVDKDHLRCYGLKDRLPLTYAQALAQGSDGSLWVGADVSIVRWKSGSSTVFSPLGLQANGGMHGVEALLPARDGSMWVGIDRPGKGLGLENVSTEKWTSIIAPGFDSSTLKAWALFLDSQNSLWVGTQDQGLFRIHNGRVAHFGASDGLTSDAPSTMFEDSEGSLWVVTSEGLDRFREMPAYAYSMKQGLSGPLVRSVLAARDGSLWVPNVGAIDVLKNGVVTSIKAKDGLPGAVVRCLFEDRKGRFWIGIDDKLVIYDRGKFKNITLPDGRSTGPVLSIAEDTNGDMWVPVFSGRSWTFFRIHGSMVEEQTLMKGGPPVISVAADQHNGIWLGLASGDLALYRDGKVTLYKEPKPKPIVPNYLRDLSVKPDGSIRAANWDGLIEWRNGESKSLTSANGLPCSYIGAFVEDVQKTLYLNMPCGVVAIPASEMDRWWNDPKSRIQFKIYDATDGARWGGEMSTDFLAARTNDGKLWFADVDVLQMIDPSRIPFHGTPPPVIVEQMAENGRTVSMKDGVALAPHLRSLVFDYTALSYIAPQKVLFRYRLEGHDTDWQDAGTRRQALYNDLPPGRYRFHVIAANADGVWNREGASLAFSVEPALYQRTWFKAFLAALACMVLWLLHLLRIAILTEQIRGRLTERIVERERIARDLHDTLLQGFQSVLLRFQTISKRLVTNPAEQEEMEDTICRADEVIAEARDKVWQLRQSSGPSMDVAGYLSSVAEVLHPHSEATFSVLVKGTPRPLLTVALEEIRAISKEALTNAFQHAQARSIQVDIQYGFSRFEVRICDDGSGMPADVWARSQETRHWGLVGIQERAKKLGASISFRKRQLGGTEVDLAVPASICYAPRAGMRFRDFLSRVWPFA